MQQREWLKFSRRARRSLLKGVADVRRSPPSTEILVPLYYLVSRSIVLIESVRPNFASSIFRVFVVRANARMHLWHMLRLLPPLPFTVHPSLVPPVHVFPESHNLHDKYTGDNLRICCSFDDSRCSPSGGREIERKSIVH